MFANTVKFNDDTKVIEYHVEEEVEANDTDYEEENDDPKQILIKLLKGRSFGKEEFGSDYESNAELKRNVETTFSTLEKHANNQFYIPDFKSLGKLQKDQLVMDETNNIKKMVGEEDKSCPKCSELMKVNYNNCQVCYRETVDMRCNHCVPYLFDLCSPKCREIYEGCISVIEITNDNDEPIIVIEDDGQNMVLKVTDHKLFYQELNQKDSLMVNKPCMNCNKNHETTSTTTIKSSSAPMEDADVDDEDEDESRIVRIGVIPIKCYNCSTNYSYLVACGTCYQKSGLQYLCDECE
jgi:hypothetical protein